MEEAEKKLFQHSAEDCGWRLCSDSAGCPECVTNIEKASKLKGSVTGIPTGFVDLDYKTSGMHPSDLVSIAARPSMGKTAFVLNIAQYMAFRKDVTVANIQSGNVKGAAGEPSAGDGIPCGFPEYAYR